MEKLKTIFAALAIILMTPLVASAWPFIDQCDPEPIECSMDHVVGPEAPRPLSVAVFDAKGGRPTLLDSSFYIDPGVDPQGDVLRGTHMQAWTMSTGQLYLEYGDITQVGYAEINNLVAVNSFFIYSNFYAGADIDSGTDIGWKILPVSQPGNFNCANTCPRSCVYGENENGMMVKCSSYEAVQCLCPWPFPQ